jgi:uncharacterized protein YukE
MVAELGQTSDPKALVPGDPDSVHGTAGSFQVYGNMLHDAGAGLQRIDTADGWRGQAGDAFRKVFHGQPSKWVTAGDCFHQASQALDSYAGTLAWAQQQAAVAVQQWNAGQAATHTAQTRHAQDVATAQQQAQAAGVPAPDIPFVDPGEAQRQAAQQTLQRARDQVKSAAATANHAVGQARDKAPQKPGFWDKVGGALDSAWHDVENVGATAVNDLASLGNAAIHHPGDVAGVLGGLLLTDISAVGEGGGLALDATGVGAIAGVPINVVSAAGITAGVGITGVSMANMMTHATGDDHVEPLKTDSGGGGGSGSADTGPGQAVGRDDLSASQQSNLDRYAKKLPSGAQETKITQLDDGSVQFETKVPGRVPGSYALYTKTVSADGTTIGYTKTTVTPDGSVAHVKDKLVP